ncbi:MAG TPA: aminoacyl-tRNA hydrolase [Humidesulfovibrio sp.]|uniref:aminoacyl-tRNA hydrolase n=1 Tax=Humidesulfovibrio sp. TaxID=2910988 RepID=UPI002B7DD120|nr:aminoacyl-tRNA hydrolase [Humidesulfovibrio sp.]HWR04566.1 aminoacyl-tRNA hydrolase [Humidesulfovibrio sp.]
MDSTPLIIALGNPGPQYERTRHNFGFMVAQAILEQAAGRKSMNLKTLQQGGDFELYSLTLGGVGCLLTRPQTFMNLSGRAVARIMGRYGIATANMVVLHDELDLPLGRMKLKRGGGSNGHRGVESIAEHTGSEDFLRLRLGIGRPQYSADVAKYVLENFGDAELPAVLDLCEAALKGLTLLFRRGQTEAVQMLNAFRLPKVSAPAEKMDTPGTLG